MQAYVCAAVLGSLFALSTEAHCQRTAPLLKDVAAARILVADPDEDGRSCGLSSDLLDAAVRLPMSNNGMKVVASEQEFAGLTPSVIVSTTVLFEAGRCTVSVSVELKRLLFTSPDKGAAVGFASVWFKSAILSGPSANMGSRVSTRVEEFTKQLIAAWLRSKSDA